MAGTSDDRSSAAGSPEQEKGTADDTQIPTAEEYPEDLPEQPVLQPREQVIGRGIAWTARWSWRWILIAVAFVILTKVVALAWTILLPLVLALVVATVLAPLSGLLENRLKLPAAAAAGLTLVGSIGLAVAAGFLVAPQVAHQGGDIVGDATAGLQRVQEWVQDSNFVSKNQVDSALETVQSKLGEQASSIASGVLTGVGAATSALVTFVVALILTFLFLKDGRKFLPWLRRMSGPNVGGHLTEVLTRAWSTLGNFIRTQALVSFIDAVFIGIGLLIVGVPLAIPLAVLTFFGGFIPIVGAFVAGILAVLVALVSNGVTGALWVAVIVIAVQQLEGNVLSPMLQSKSMNLHAAVVLLAVSLGGTLYGISGAFLAVPVVAVVAVVFRYLDEMATAESLRPASTSPPWPPVDRVRDR